MKDWWYNRNRREQLAMGIGLAFMAGVMVWALWLLPMSERQAALEARIHAQQVTLQHLAEARSLLAERAASAVQRQGFGDRSLASVVEQGMRMAGLAAAIRRIEPVGDDAVSVVLEQAAFDPLIRWLQEAGRNQGIFVRELSVEAAGSEGTVNTRLQLATGS